MSIHFPNVWFPTFLSFPHESTVPGRVGVGFSPIVRHESKQYMYLFSWVLQKRMGFSMVFVLLGCWTSIPETWAVGKIGKLPLWLGGAWCCGNCEVPCTKKRPRALKPKKSHRRCSDKCWHSNSEIKFGHPNHPKPLRLRLGI